MSNLAKTILEANARLVEDGDIKLVADYFSEKYVVRIGSATKRGHGAVRGYNKTIHKAFSKLKVDVKIFMEVDDEITWQRTIRGKQTGAFQGFPASDLVITWHDMVVSRIENDKIAKEWVVTDMAEALLRSRKH